MDSTTGSSPWQSAPTADETSPRVVRGPDGPPSAERRWLPTACMLSLLGLKLWLVSAQPATCYADAVHDDRLFVNLAWHLTHGDWLGPYNNLTLAKGPMYPIWLALVDRCGLPLFLCQHLLYAVGCALVLHALRPLRLSTGSRLLLFGVLQYNPMTWASEYLRIVREGIYPALTLLVLSAAIGLMLRRSHSTRTLAGWSSALGLALTAFWLTREEGVWIVPTLAILLLPLHVAVGRENRIDRVRRTCACALWLPLFLGGLAIVSSVNRVYYGVFCTVEYKQRDFLRAYGSLVRVTPARHQQYVAVARETRQRIYAVSPTFRELELLLDGPLNDGYSIQGAHLKPDEEMASGWFMWALRDAVQFTGHCRTGGDAADFYAKLADEVNSACACGELVCGPPRATMRPVWRAGDVSRLAGTIGRMLSYVTTFKGCHPYAKDSTGPLPGRQFMGCLTREQVAVGNGTPDSPDGWGPLSTRLGMLQNIGHAYQILTPPLAALAACLWLHTGFSVVRRRVNIAFHIVATSIAVGFASRIAMLSLIDISWIPSINTLYPAPAYPLLLLFVCLSLATTLRRDAPRPECDLAG